VDSGEGIYIIKNKDFQEYFLDFEKRMALELKEMEREKLKKVILGCHGDSRFDRPVAATVNKDKIVDV